MASRFRYRKLLLKALVHADYIAAPNLVVLLDHGERGIGSHGGVGHWFKPFRLKNCLFVGISRW
jgi:hypothetical protein